MESIQSALLSMLGDRLAGVVLFGSAARREDFTPLSDINVAVITNGKVPPEERVAIAEALGTDFSVVVLSVEELKQLASDGEFLAHEILRGGRILYADTSLYEALNFSPPVTSRTREFLERHALACVGLSLENYFAGRFHYALNYAYRGLRSAARCVSARDGELCFSDSEVAEALRRRGFEEAAEVYGRLRRGRFLGVGKGDLYQLLLSAYKQVFRVLGLGEPDFEGLVSRVEKTFVYVSEVKLTAERGRVKAEVAGVGAGGREERLEEPLVLAAEV